MSDLTFEKDIIDPILDIISENINYLTQPENLPQLAKLGYMYDTLWYVGRVCYGSDGQIQKGYDCEDNPKYKLEVCNVGTEEQFDLIYDAWGMHISNNKVTFEQLRTKVLEGRELSEFDKFNLKPQKTLDDWLYIMTHPEYLYRQLYPNRRRALSQAMCTIGTGYGFKNGYRFKQASGADQDKSSYGDWENAIFALKIQEKIESLLENPMLKEAMDTTCVWYDGVKRKEAIRDSKYIYETLCNLSEGDNPDYEKFLQKYMDGTIFKELDKMLGKPKVKEEDKYTVYYPISEYSIISKVDADSHESYIKGAIEICQDILAHLEEETSREYGSRNNIPFAEEFLKRDWVQKYL